MRIIKSVHWLPNLASIPEEKIDGTSSKNNSRNQSASSNIREARQSQNNLCSVAVGIQKIRNCALFKNISVNDH